MSWVRLDDAHGDHPKIAPLSDRAYRLWIRAIAHSNRFGLNGVLTASQLRQIRVPIRAKLVHETELVSARLWIKTDAGVTIHDVEDYQPTAAKSADLSKKRSEAGKLGAAKRWQTDSKLPMAKNAPSRPVPSPIDIQDETEYPARDVEEIGTPTLGRLGGKAMGMLVQLAPLRGWEIKAGLGAGSPNWGYFAKVVQSARTEAAKPKPPAGKKRTPPQPPTDFGRAEPSTEFGNGDQSL